MENNQKTIDTLNELVEINNERTAGYDQAYRTTEETNMKTLFSKLAESSKQYREELATEVKKLGGKPRETTVVSGKPYRVWTDIKTALNKKDPKAILNSFESGEDYTVSAYENALNTTALKPEVQTIVKKQVGLIKAEHTKVKDLRNNVTKTM